MAKSPKSKTKHSTRNKKLVAERFATEIPQKIYMDLLNQVSPAIQKAAELYKTQLGEKNPYTVAAYQRLSVINERINANDANPIV